MKYTQLTDSLYEYVCRHRSSSEDPVMDQLRKETLALGDDSRMMIAPEQSSFMTLLVAASGAKNTIEVGTFTGSSSIAIARGLPADGKLICVDASAEWTSIAKKFWKLAGVEHKIELWLGEGKSILQQLPPNLLFDFAFVDADKPGYDAYFELLFPRLRQNALILFDNVLWGADAYKPDATDNDRALHALNEKLTRDPRLETVLLPISEGILMCRKK
jgi:caffeoyl-CoA O-methyltransferase